MLRQAQAEGSRLAGSCAILRIELCGGSASRIDYYMTHRYLGPLLVSLIAGAVVLATITPSNGPGITCDELYHVYQGKQLVTDLRQQGFGFFLPANIEKNFAWSPDGPPVQAPLGYWILGWTHWIFDSAPDSPMAVSIVAARFAPAMAFAFLVFLVGAYTGRREGAMAGVLAAVAVALTPRLFAHAHFASLDMLTTLFFVAAVLAVLEAERGGRTWAFALAGVVWGCSMLVRLHGLLLVPPVVLWLLWTTYRRGQLGQRWWAWNNPLTAWSKGLVVWLMAGVSTFIVGWPWLWASPVSRFWQYVASGAGRQALHVFYEGQAWPDRIVPWHYPWVIFAVTIPAGFLILGGIGIWARLWHEHAESAMQPLEDEIAIEPGRYDMGEVDFLQLRPDMFLHREVLLLLGVGVVVLFVFSLPGTPVYDGERLFLMVFPLWAIAVGIGAKQLIGVVEERERGVGEAALETIPMPDHHHHAKVGRRHHEDPRLFPIGIRGEMPTRFSPGSRLRMAAVVVFVALQGLGVVLYHPCQLSYYNSLVGGLAGAQRLGFEVTYWGDSVLESMLARAAELSPGQPILFAPNLAPFQAPAITITSPSLRQAETEVLGMDQMTPNVAKRCRYALVYNRRADPQTANSILERGKVVAEYEKQGVWLTRLVELPSGF